MGLPRTRQFTPADFAKLQQDHTAHHVFLWGTKIYAVDAEELMHPGGREVLDEHRGKDIKALFEGASGHKHSKGAALLLERYYCGDLVAEGSKANQGGRTAATVSQDCVVDESKPLLSQVVKLDPATYMAWVAVPSTGHPKMFDNQLVERLTSSPWYVVPLLWLPIAAAMMWVSASMYGVSLPLLVALFPLGILVWQLFEYSVHRWLFHFDPVTPQGIKTHFLMHGHHHKYPMDFDRLVFPPAPAALVAGLWYLLLRALCSQGITYGLMSGGIVGYVLYDTTHWALHSGAWTPALLDGKLKSAHMWHHYEDEQRGFGISSRLYDLVFGTLAKPKKA